MNALTGHVAYVCVSTLLLALFYNNTARYDSGSKEGQDDRSLYYIYYSLTIATLFLWHSFLHCLPSQPSKEH